MSLQMYEQAKNCNNCLEWHHICGAECCKEMSFEGGGVEKKKYRRGQLVHFALTTMTEDKKWWYELHGAKVEGTTVTTRVMNHEVRGNKLVLYNKCKNLGDDYKCKEWSSGNRPQHCKDLTLETSKSPKHCLTPKCLFNFKENKQ